jgi:hypothetical protein
MAHLTLLEFIGCCMEKNDLVDGALQRWNVYETCDLAELQASALASEGTALLGAPSVDRSERVQRWIWPTLQIMHCGLAVMVVMPVRVKEAYFVWSNTSYEMWRRAHDDLVALFDARRSITSRE